MKRKLIEDKNVVLYEDDIAAAVLPANAAAKGHIIILPKRKVKYIEELSEEESEHIFYVSSYAATVLFESLGAQGTNIITNEGEEFYIDVVARKQDDGLNFQWQPKQLHTPEMDSVMSSISNKIVIDQDSKPSKEPSMSEPQHPPKIKEQPSDVMSDEEENYLLKQLDRIP
ncbi:HIT domain-containing protein [archaeon]|nr:HIT domain-containing protein [archaeon]MBL7057119.1 HIT domain-containing protein [Candidatus Woesearchaeota archaeon]